MITSDLIKLLEKSLEENGDKEIQVMSRERVGGDDYSNVWHGTVRHIVPSDRFITQVELWTTA